MALSDSAQLLFKIKSEYDKAGTAAAKGDIEALTAAAAASQETFAALASSATIAAASIAAIGAAALAAGGLLLNLAKDAADYGSQIHDAADKTGLTTTAIAALKLAAEQAGSSFEQVIKGVTVFGVEIGKMAEGDAKATATLKNLGVTSTDLDEALKQVFTRIYNAHSDVERLSLAAAAFGRKIGPDLIPLIKDSQGNFDNLIKTVKELGLDVTPAASDAADRFGDRMDVLGKQLTAVKIKIGDELIPVFQDWADELSNFLSKNQGEVESWGRAIAKTTRLAILDLQQEKNDLLAIGEILDSLNPLSNTTWDSLPARLKAIGDESQRIIGERNKINNPPPPIGDPSLREWRSGEKDAYYKRLGLAPDLSDAVDQKEVEARAKARQEAFEKELSERGKQLGLLLKQERDQFTEINGEWEKQFTAGEKTKEEYRTNALNNIITYGQRAQKLLDDQLKINLNGKTGTAGENARLEFQNASAALNKELEREREDVNKNIGQSDKKATDDQLKVLEDANRRKLALQQSYNQLELAQTKAKLDAGEITEIDYLRREELLTRQAASARIVAVQEEIDLRKKLGLTTADQENELKILDNQFSTVVVENRTKITNAEKKLHDERTKSWNDYVKGLKDEDDKDQARIDRETADTASKNQSQAEKQFGFLGKSSLTTGFDQLGHPVNQLSGAFDALKQIGGDALHGLAQGIGQIVQNFVLMGNAGDASMRKIVASVLAGVAAQAAVNAVMELAYGIAALTPWGAAIYGPAPLHFEAAALFGSIALGTGLAGRAVAGNSFNQAKNGSASGTTASVNSGLSDANAAGNNFRSPMAAYNDQMERMNYVNGQLTMTLSKLDDKLTSIKPGDVVAAGAMDAGGQINAAMQQHFTNDTSAANNFSRALGGPI